MNSLFQFFLQHCFFFVLTPVHQNQQLQISVNSSSLTSSRYCIEYLNHEIYGDLHSQMIFGESFEEIAGIIASQNTSNMKSIESNSFESFFIRHCSFDLYICDVTDNSINNQIDDFNWILHKPCLNGQNGTISFESSNYNGRYITLINDNSLETYRLGIVELNLSNTDINTNEINLATFNFISINSSKSNNNSNSSGVFSLSNSFIAIDESNVYYVTINENLEGGCSGSYATPSSDVILAPLNNITNKSFIEWKFTNSHITGGTENATLGYISFGAGRTGNNLLVTIISELNVDSILK